MKSKKSFYFDWFSEFVTFWLSTEKRIDFLSTDAMRERDFQRLINFKDFFFVCKNYRLDYSKQSILESRLFCVNVGR